MPHLEVNQSYFKISGNKVIIMATHEEVPTSKSYMGPMWMLMWKGGRPMLFNSFPTSKSTKLKDFFKKCQG